MWRRTLRIILPLLMLPCVGFGAAEGTLSPGLKTNLKEILSHSRQSPTDKVVLPVDEPVLQLEPFKVTDTADFQLDIAKAARQAAADREAKKFSLLKGGLLHSWQFGGKQVDLGIWPMLVSQNEELFGRLARNQDLLKIRVDLLRIKW